MVHVKQGRSRSPWVVAVLAIAILVACGGGGQETGGKGAPTYSVGGKVAGLSTGRLVLSNGVEVVEIASQAGLSDDQNFEIGSLPQNAKYDIRVASQPPGFDCRLQGGSGTVGTTVVRDIVVQCFKVKSLLVVAGPSPLTGAQDGLALDARFKNIRDIAVDSLGNAYIVDGNAIRKLSPAGVVTTLAGVVDLEGFVDGDGPEARFNSPSGIAVDADDQVIVADTLNHVVRQISKLGHVTLIAGQPLRPGGDDGDAKSTASFNRPSDIAIDKNGLIYIADALNHTIRRLNKGAIETYPKKATYVGAGIQRPLGKLQSIAFADDGTLVLTDVDNRSIRRIDADGNITVVAGDQNTLDNPGDIDGPLASARFRDMYGIAVDGSSIYVSEPVCGTLRRIDKAAVTTLVGDVNCLSIGSAEALNGPLGIAVGPAHELLVADNANFQLKKVAAGSAVPVTLPQPVTLAGVGNDVGFQDGASNVARFKQIGGLAIGTDQSIFVADAGNNAIRRIDAAGTTSTIPDGSFSESRAQAIRSLVLSRPTALVFDSKGTLYIANRLRNEVIKIGQDGVTRIFAKTFTSPTALAVDAADTVIVADASGNGAIWRIAPNEDVTQIASGLHEPWSVTVGSNGNIFFVEKNRPEISLIEPGKPPVHLIYDIQDPVVTTIALTCDKAGNLYAYSNLGLVSYVVDKGQLFTKRIVPIGSSTLPGPLPASIDIDITGLFTTGMVVNSGKLLISDGRTVFSIDL
jgi:sugar lactone lactonase YvrE